MFFGASVSFIVEASRDVGYAGLLGAVDTKLFGDIVEVTGEDGNAMRWRS